MIRGPLSAGPYPAGQALCGRQSLPRGPADKRGPRRTGSPFLLSPCLPLTPCLGGVGDQGAGLQPLLSMSLPTRGLVVSCLGSFSLVACLVVPKSTPPTFVHSYSKCLQSCCDRLDVGCVLMGLGVG